MLDTEKLADWARGDWLGTPPRAVDGVCIDTRLLRVGELFFALQGEQRDGHDFVADAFARGAGAAVVSRPPDSLPDQPCLLVRDTTIALQQMACSYRKAIHPHVVGITGSVGKSTVKDMTARMLSASIPTASTRGNWNNHIGLPLSLLCMGSDTKACVLEMGTNHPGELKLLCDIAQPDCAIVTNVGPVHTEFFDSVQAIAREKATLVAALPDDGIAVLNKDNEFFDVLAAQVPCQVRTVSLCQPADYQCVRWSPDTREAVIRDRVADEDVVLRMALPGEFNVVNALLAAAIARSMEAPWSDIHDALSSFKGGSLRWEALDMNGIHVINDSYNANPMNMRGSIGAFQREVTDGARWLVLAGMLELGERERSEHLALGRMIGTGPWAGLIVIGELGRLIADGAIEAGFSPERTFRCDSEADVCRVFHDHVEKGSDVLFKGSRHFHLETIVERLGHA